MVVVGEISKNTCTIRSDIGAKEREVNILEEFREKRPKKDLRERSAGSRNVRAEPARAGVSFTLAGGRRRRAGWLEERDERERGGLPYNACADGPGFGHYSGRPKQRGSPPASKRD